jgi:hypothetical protein
VAGIKGYPSNEKLSDTRQEFVTVSKIGPHYNALDVRGHFTYTSVGSVSCDAGSTDRLIAATAHGARVGDVISFTSGALSGTEYVVETVPSVNSIGVGVTLPAIPSAGDTFEVLAPKAAQVSSSGSTINSPVRYILNGSEQEVIKDDGTPANNRPLPVELVNALGEIAIEAANLNLEVQTSHTGANPDSIQVGDGTTVLEMLAASRAAKNTQVGYAKSFLYRRDYGSSPLNTAAGYEELNASIPDDIDLLEIFDSSGETLLIGLGAASSEVDEFYILPGGNGKVYLHITSGTRVAVKAVSNNATSGELTINAFKLR